MVTGIIVAVVLGAIALLVTAVVGWWLYVIVRSGVFALTGRWEPHVRRRSYNPDPAGDDFFS